MVSDPPKFVLKWSVATPTQSIQVEAQFRGPTKRRFRHRPTPYSYTSRNHDISEDLCPKKCSKALDKKDWEETTCSVCMECPQNAVLLLCSSHDNGCRPYMCGTSFQYSNCLDQYKKFYTKVLSSNEDEPLISSFDNPVSAPRSGLPVEKRGVTELACPLCRGQVKGWTVVEPAREYLNAKKRSCMQDDCTFVGTFKELRKHMRSDHPCAQPREADPVLKQKWRRLVQEREQEDVISIIRSAIPGTMVFGDYVIEGNRHGFGTDEDDGLDVDTAERNGGLEASLDRNFIFLLLHAFGPSRNDLCRQPRQPTHTADDTSPVGLSDPDDDNFSSDDNDGGNISLVSRLRQRRRSRRDATGDQI
ncbi:separase-like isoform X1 [Hibiscus syriacus]|uniref:Separase-like isoform X1 n=1 Tax=Hibiscus syriacus TaxID=106335 RepID=A0A6A2WLS6_HIBSY|nr:separase-like isoform X1 [Hibiscus syriacus]